MHVHLARKGRHQLGAKRPGVQGIAGAGMAKKYDLQVSKYWINN